MSKLSERINEAAEVVLYDHETRSEYLTDKERDLIVRAVNRDHLFDEAVKALNARADGYESRADTIYNGAIIAEELRHWSAALAKAQP